MELRLNDETGPLLGTMKFGSSGPRFNWRSGVTGTVLFEQPLPDMADICLVLKPGVTSELRIDHFHFFAAPQENP